MSNAKDDARTAPPVKPRVLPLKTATIFMGMSRSAIYRAAAAGRLRLLKNGRATVLDVASGEKYLAELPEAQIGAAKDKGGAS